MNKFAWLQVSPVAYHLFENGQKDLLAIIMYLGTSNQWVLLSLGRLAGGYRTLEEIAEVATKLRELNTRDEVYKYHEWVARMDMVACKNCGYVRRHDGRNDFKPCKGIVRVTTR